SLTRSPAGRLQTLQTLGIYPSPQGVQQLWSNVTRRRYPREWDGQPTGPYGYVIEWEPRRIACGRCHRELGEYVAYAAAYSNGAPHPERGVVENTPREYLLQAELSRGQPGVRGPKMQPRYWLDGEICRSAERTTAYLRCPGCGQVHERNLARLG